MNVCARRTVCVLTIAFVIFGSTLRAAPPPLHAPRMSWLDNGAIKLGVDLEIGGAITYLSRSGQDDNVVNSWDYGRQVQLSFYSGPIPFVVGDKQPAEVWKNLGWNPIQSGDHFGHRSRVLETTNDGRTIYVKCVPMQWPMDDVPSECTFESWLSLDGPVVKARARINNARTDKTQYAGRTQELPAVYSNGPYHKLMTYVGDKPFTNDELTRIEKKPEEKGPWSHWRATEHWAALVNDAGFGLGVHSPGCSQFSGGFAGKPGAGGPHDDPTGYIAPNQAEILDHNIQYEFTYELILGSLDEIRKQVYARSEKLSPPNFRFERNRRSWIYANARDVGWPIRGELSVVQEKSNPQLVSPPVFFPATDAPILFIEAAFNTKGSLATVYWATFSEPDFHASRHLSFPITSDGEYRTYEVPLSSSAEYKGLITRLRLDPGEAAGTEPLVLMRSVSVMTLK